MIRKRKKSKEEIRTGKWVERITTIKGNLLNTSLTKHSAKGKGIVIFFHQK